MLHKAAQCMVLGVLLMSGNSYGWSWEKTQCALEEGVMTLLKKPAHTMIAVSSVVVAYKITKAIDMLISCQKGIIEWVQEIRQKEEEKKEQQEVAENEFDDLGFDDESEEQLIQDQVCKTPFVLKVASLRANLKHNFIDFNPSSPFPAVTSSRLA